MYPTENLIQISVYKRLTSRRGVRGFTLIEILVVIGIISLLTVGLFFGGKYAVTSGRTRSAKVTLTSLQGTLESASISGLFKKQPAGAWISASGMGDTWVAFQDAAGNPIQDPTSKRFADFWRQPDSRQSPVEWKAPGSVIPDNVETWQSSDLVRNTGMALAMLHNVPAAATTLDALPSTSSLIPAFWNATSTYPLGSRVAYTKSTGALVYVALKPVGVNVPPTGVTDSNWKVSYATVLDPWGNPTIFVPACGITVTVNGVSTTIKAPNGKPFFASAGPDGDFLAGDDNLYSFE